MQQLKGIAAGTILCGSDGQASISQRESGAGTHIWHFSHVMTNCVIGENCNMGQNVHVASGVRIGNNVKIQNNVSLYTGVELEDDVFCGPSMVFTNVTNPRSFVNRKNEYKKTMVRRGASLGANSTIVCGVTIGEYAFAGAGAVVTRDVRAFRAGGRFARRTNRLDVPLRGAAAHYRRDARSAKAAARTMAWKGIACHHSGRCSGDSPASRRLRQLRRCAAFANRRLRKSTRFIAALNSSKPGEPFHARRDIQGSEGV